MKTGIKERREVLGMTQLNIAKATGLNSATISFIERGSAKHTYPKAMRLISQALKMKEEELDFNYRAKRKASK